MFDRRSTRRPIDDRTYRAVSLARWADKAAQAAQGAELLARMDAAGVDSLLALYALEGR